MLTENNHKVDSEIQIEHLREPSKLIRSRMVSSTPGRMRLKVAQQHRNDKTLAPITQALKSHLGIYEVRTNLHSGSITILHAPEHISFGEIYVMLRDLGIIFIDIAGEKTEVAEDITSAIYDLNRRVKQTTNGVVDLRILMPLGLGMLAVRQLLVKGLQLEIIPWYVLAWYSFDSFIKLHYTSEPKQIKN
jgi:Heavy metal associated domain 2